MPTNPVCELNALGSFTVTGHTPTIRRKTNNANKIQFPDGALMRLSIF